MWVCELAAAPVSLGGCTRALTNEVFLLSLVLPCILMRCAHTWAHALVNAHTCIIASSPYSRKPFRSHKPARNSFNTNNTLAQMLTGDHEITRRDTFIDGSGHEGCAAEGRILPSVRHAAHMLTRSHTHLHIPLIHNRA